MRKEENVVLRLMECLPPAVGYHIFTIYFMDNHLTSFHLLTRFGVDSIHVTGESTRPG